MSVRISIKIVGADKASDDFKRVRRNLNREVKAGLEHAARIGADHAADISPRKTGNLAGHIEPYATSRVAYVRVKTKKVPYAGLIEFGGTRRDVIEPRNGEAIMTPYGPVARVTTPRVYKGQQMIKRGLEERQPQIKLAIEKALDRLFTRST